MGLQLVPGFIGQSGYNHPVELFRNYVKGATAKGKGYMGSSNDFSLTPSGANMSMSIAEGFASILGQENNQQGSYFVWSNASESIAWPAAAGQARIDSLLLRVIDTQYGTDPSPNGAYWEVVEGVPAGSPAARLDSDFLPGGGFHRPGAWWRVANVLVPSGITNLGAATVTDLRSYADFQRDNNNAVYNWKTGQVDAAWTSYTPTLIGSTSNPTLGTGGVAHGRWKRIGRNITVEAYCRFGTSGTGAGVGTWAVSLPVSTANVTDAAWMGKSYYRDDSAAASGHIMGFCIAGANATSASLYGGTAAAGQVTGTSPFGWNINDFIRIELEYEAATA